MRRFLIWLSLGLSYCESSPRNCAPVKSASRTPDSGHTMNNIDDTSEPQSTTIAFGGAEIPLTVDDAKAMQTALLTYLTSVDTSHVEDRDYLIARTTGAPAWIDTDGVVRISAWVLQSRSDRLVLTHRMPAGEEADVIKAYVATLVRDDRWHVASIATERIWRRR